MGKPSCVLLLAVPLPCGSLTAQAACLAAGSVRRNLRAQQAAGSCLTPVNALESVWLCSGARFLMIAVEAVFLISFLRRPLFFSRSSTSPSTVAT